MIDNKNKIICFTVNAFDDGYYKDGLPVDEANRKMWLYNVENYSHIFDFKVFDYNHPLVIECKEKYKEFFDRKEIWKSVKTDVVRLYILSKLPYHLYIDDDVVLLDNFEIKNEEDYFFSDMDTFCCIYNSNNLDVFKKILEMYPFDDKQLYKLEKKIFIKDDRKKNIKEENFILYINYKRSDNALFKKMCNFIFLNKKSIINKTIKHYNYVNKYTGLLNIKEINFIVLDTIEKENIIQDSYIVCKKFYSEEYLINLFDKSKILGIEKNNNNLKVKLI
jgi:hypothetical protein